MELLLGLTRQQSIVHQVLGINSDRLLMTAGGSNTCTVQNSRGRLGVTGRTNTTEML